MDPVSNSHLHEKDGDNNIFTVLSSDTGQAQRKSMGFREAVDITVMAKRWQSVCKERRKIRHRKSQYIHVHAAEKGSDDPTSSILCEDYDDPNVKQPKLFGRDVAEMTKPDELSRSLLHYFVQVSNRQATDVYADELDVDFIGDLINRGATVNFPDRHGQTVLHEVARNWHPSVMTIMCDRDRGGDVNSPDKMGWTPLHVAAECDYADMCKELVRLNANKEAKAKNGQTPLFFAAKTDSTRALKALMKLGCDCNAVDYRGRTPLFVACELDRSATAALLIEHKCDAFVRDNTGQMAFVPLLEKMPPLAAKALEPLHKTLRMERKQTFDLFKLDPLMVREESNKEVVHPTSYHSALEAIIQTNNHQVIILPIIEALITAQWEEFGRSRAIGQIILQLVNIILWTTFAVDKEWTSRFKYEFPQDGYRIAILVSAISITVFLIVDEIMEYSKGKKRHKAWQDLKLDLIEQDVQFVHPKHSDEGLYLWKEAEEVKQKGIAYFEDWWNYLDWICYVILLTSVITHFIDVGYPGGEGNLMVARWHVRIMALNIVVLWIRLLKYVKPFEFFGPFIVMLGAILEDLFKFFLFYLEFFIPFACIFWMILGGTDNMKDSDTAMSGTLKNYTTFNFTRVSVDNLDTISSMLITLFRLTMVDSYDYKNMVTIDQVTAQVFLGCWFSISSILFLNLFVAQLSETFKTVFDNAKAVAAMQKAIKVLDCYNTMSMSAKVAYHKKLREEYNPIKTDYDDDVTRYNMSEEVQKATLEIRSMADDLQTKLNRLHTREMVHSDSEDSEANEEVGDKRGRSRRKTKSRQLAEKSARKISTRLDNLETDTRGELQKIKAMLGDIAIVVANLNKPDSTPGLTLKDAVASIRQVNVRSDDRFGGGGGGGITEVEPAAPQAQNI